MGTSRIAFLLSNALYMAQSEGAWNGLCGIRIGRGGEITKAVRKF
jgi:hypothetical protein